MTQDPRLRVIAAMQAANPWTIEAMADAALAVVTESQDDERARLIEAVRALDAAHAQAAREVGRLREALTKLADAAQFAPLDLSRALTNARAALAGEGRND